GRTHSPGLRAPACESARRDRRCRPSCRPSRSWQKVRRPPPLAAPSPAVPHEPERAAAHCSGCRRGPPAHASECRPSIALRSWRCASAKIVLRARSSTQDAARRLASGARPAAEDGTRLVPAGSYPRLATFGTGYPGMSVASKGTGEMRANGQAIAVMCVGVLCLAANDALAKWLTAHYSPLQLAFLRSLLALPLTAAVALMLSGREVLHTRHMRVHALRGLLSVGATYAFFSGLKVLPIAEATALVFAAPIFITVLSVPLLGEHVGWRRWLAVLTGFAGVLVIVRPGAAAFQPASLFILAAALLYALVMLSARWIDRQEGF